MENYFYNKSHFTKITYIYNFAVKKNKFIVPIKSMIKPIPWLYENGISFIGLFVEDEKYINKSLIVINPLSYTIYGVNE